MPAQVDNVILCIAICTYNRSFILSECLDSILAQLQPRIRILVVDNGSTDHTKELVATYQAKFACIDYIVEPTLGLSHARNAAIRHTKTKWIGYVDDDALLCEGFISRVLYWIRQDNHAAFGGYFEPWFRYGQPPWIPLDSVSGTRWSEEAKTLKKGFLPGGCMFFKKTALEEVGGFNPALGKVGQRLAYGEDDEIQIRLRKQEHIIAFDPALCILHCVMPEKLKLSWHIKERWKKGESWQLINRKPVHVLLLKTLLSIAGAGIRRFPSSVYRLIMQPAYFWQNLLLDVVGPLIFYLAACSAAIKPRKEQ